MKTLFALLLVIFISGCADLQTQSQLTSTRDWASSRLEKAKSGEIKWSEYYTEFYDRIYAVNSFQDKGYYMEVLALSIDAAKAYESGKISDEEFKSFQRKSQAQAIQHDEDLRMNNQREAARAFNQYIQTQLLLNQEWQARQPIYCNSTQVGHTVNTRCN